MAWESGLEVILFDAREVLDRAGTYLGQYLADAYHKSV